MNDDAFARLVAEEIKNNVTQEQRDYLNLPENWTRWQRAVNTLARNLDNQLETIRTTEQREIEKYQSLGKDGIKLLAEVTAEFDNRRKKIERFRYHVITRLDEISRMIALGTDAIDERMKTVEFLRKAIEAHRDTMRHYDMEATPIDAALWKALDGQWKFDDINEESMTDYLS